MCGDVTTLEDEGFAIGFGGLDFGSCEEAGGVGNIQKAITMPKFLLAPYKCQHSPKK
jgi:hypothetical protein